MAHGNSGTRSKKYLYHYTDEDGINGIEDSQMIYMSEDTNRDAVLGEGVYFTDLAPHSPSDVILQNNYGQAMYGQESKITWYVRFFKQDLHGVRKQRFGNRIIYVYPEEIDLEEFDDVKMQRRHAK